MSMKVSCVSTCPQINIVDSEFVLIFQHACPDRIWCELTKSICAWWCTPGLVSMLGCVVDSLNLDLVSVFVFQIMGFGAALLDGVDPNPFNFVGAGVIHTKTTQVGCLLRLEPNTQAQVCSPRLPPVRIVLHNRTLSPTLSSFLNGGWKEFSISRQCIWPTYLTPLFYFFRCTA